MIETINQIIWGKAFVLILKTEEYKNCSPEKTCSARSKSGDLVVSAGNPVELKSKGWTKMELPSSVLSAVLRREFETYETRTGTTFLFGDESKLREYAERKGIVIK